MDILWNSEHRHDTHCYWFHQHHRSHHHHHHMQQFQQQDFKQLPAAAATLKVLLTWACICILHCQLVASVQLKYSSGIRSMLNYTTVNVPFCFILYLIYWDFGESFGVAENKTLKLAIKFKLITLFIFNVISCSALCFLY